MKKLRRFKNRLGLCACKGCFRPIRVQMQIKEDNHGQWGVTLIKDEFWICNKHWDKVFEWMRGES